MMHVIPEEHIELLHALNVNDVQFFERNILNHLSGVYQILRDWSVDEALALAGLFHAVYLTNFFSSNEPNRTNRDRVRGSIGKDAEQIAYRYCVMDRVAFVQNGEQKPHGFKDGYTDEFVTLTEAEDRMLVELIWANSIEQIVDRGESFTQHEQLQAAFEISRHRVGKQAILGYQSLI